MKPLAQLIGQPTAVELLEKAIATSRIAPAYLFVGPEGIGRALAAACFAQMLLIQPEQNYTTLQQKLSTGNHPDFLRVQPTYSYQGKLLTSTEAEAISLKRKTPPQIRIEQIRAITQFLTRPPLQSPRSVVVLENAEHMAEAAANALLKTLEEPGQGTIILIARGVEAILPTLTSRCQQIPFYRLSEANLKLVLQRADCEEILQYPELLQLAQGSPGKAIVNFQKLQALPPDLMLKLKELPQNQLSVLFLAREVTQKVELDTQLWLIDYLQYLYWQKYQNQEIIKTLETARQALYSYVQPRLVWECCLLSLISEEI